MQDFIYIRDNALAPEECLEVISMIENFCTYSKIEGSDNNHERPRNLGRDDVQIYCPEELEPLYPLIADRVFDCYEEYKNQVSSLEQISLYMSGFKFQKTPIGGGFHLFHTERSGGGASQNREMTWMVYLNDVEEGGETEFLYQKTRVKPKAGSLVMWPAGFTHPHRGNPPLSNDKYIVTGWMKTAGDPSIQYLLDQHTRKS